MMMNERVEKMSYKIAVDLMGSDDAPRSEINGIKRALEQMSDLTIIAFGLEEAITQIGYTHERLTYVYTTDVVTGDDAAATAFRVKKESSMIRALQAVKDKEADAVVSSGNTGAYITSALFMLGRIKGVKRPALISTFPTAIKNKKLIFGDLGAVADADSETIAQNGVLVSEIARILLDVQHPQVALLNIGSEEKKGSETYIAAHQLLKDNVNLNFVGNIEPRYLMQGHVDAIVSGGFDGNITLKSYEGAIELVTGQLKAGIMSGFLTKLGGVLIKPALRSLKEMLDYDAVGGAIVAGIKAPVIKTHGTTTDGQIAGAIFMAQKFLKNELIANIEQNIQKSALEK